ncbi:hypothetical protein MRB53_008798 [Persea americana]|uniref:Uncharacterized protein n=1 Tax=Persea americana TaxID=3435 RepID=A0ACC2LMA5_PERAE|nr:hypothetical protein MRB53_008798 [Persea americana]
MRFFSSVALTVLLMHFFQVANAVVIAWHLGATLLVPDIRGSNLSEKWVRVSSAYRAPPDPPLLIVRRQSCYLSSSPSKKVFVMPKEKGDCYFHSNIVRKE